MLLFEDQKQWREANPLKIFRTTKNLSQKEVTELLGVGQNVVGTWEKGRSTPTGENASKLIALGFDINLLIEWKKAKPLV